MNFCKQFLDSLLKGDGSVINITNIGKLNDEAMKLYNIPILNEEQIEDLKSIIMSCNIIYNRTDLDMMAIEDGFYDLLLEKYKTYDSNFQVGSAVVDLKNIIEQNSETSNKVIQPFTFLPKVERNELRQDIFNEIMRYGKPILNNKDFYQSPLIFDRGNITKRSHNTEHNHPDLVGTLDKCKFVLDKDAINAGVYNDPNVKILERDFFQDHIDKGIIKTNQEIEIVCELKYDGVSVEADCGLELISARSRGDTGIGAAADMTPILEGYPFKHAGPMIGENPIGVKFEAIMTKSDLELFNKAKDKNYANCRTAIVGLMGSSDSYKYRDYITLIPLAVDRDQVYWIENRIEEIKFVNRIFRSKGEPLRYCYFKGTVSEILYYIKCFLDEANIARDYLNFMYDGIVVSYLDENIRAKLGRENYINKYSMAVKFDPAEKKTIVRGITYEVGQHGTVTPMIHYDPVEFIGTIHTKSTGSSLKRFNELDLSYGDYISVKYVNDVMPYVSKLECEHNKNNDPRNKFIFVKNCPICNTELVTSSSGDTAICPNRECPGRTLKRMVNMFAKLNIKGFAEASFKLISNITHFYQLFQYDANYYIDKLGEADGRNMSLVLKEIYNNKLKDYVFMGALGFTSIAKKKWQSILSDITLKEIYDLYTNAESIQSFYDILPIQDGITKETIVNEIGFFIPDIEFALSSGIIIDSKGSNKTKMQIRFTGIRNQQLMELLNSNGYDADDGAVTKKTDILLIPYSGFNSTKVTKAQQNSNTKIVPIQDFLENMNLYINENLK